jgi:hypothetical protein
MFGLTRFRLLYSVHGLETRGARSASGTLSRASSPFRLFGFLGHPLRAESLATLEDAMHRPSAVHCCVFDLCPLNSSFYFNTVHLLYS